MLKISNRTSTMISFVFAVLLVAVIALMMLILPFAIESAPMLLEIQGYFSEKTLFGVSGGVVFWIWMYVALLIAESCCVAMLFLLFRVRRGLVFSEISISLIRFVSWGCLLIGLVCILVVYFFHMSYLIALAAGFLGLCLRVVKNVIEEATEIKSENDLTV